MRWSITSSEPGIEPIGERVVDQVVGDDEHVGVARVLDAVALERAEVVGVAELAAELARRSPSSGAGARAPTSRSRWRRRSAVTRSLSSSVLSTSNRKTTACDAALMRPTRRRLGEIDPEPVRHDVLSIVGPVAEPRPTGEPIQELVRRHLQTPPARSVGPPHQAWRRAPRPARVCGGTRRGRSRAPRPAGESCPERPGGRLIRDELAVVDEDGLLAERAAGLHCPRRSSPLATCGTASRSASRRAWVPFPARARRAAPHG